MSFWQNLTSIFHQYFSITSISVKDIIEMVIIAVLIYYVIIWFKHSRAWTLFKGIVVLLIIIALAEIFSFNTISWIASKVISIGIVAIVVIFQPELRRTLEHLGKRNFFGRLFSSANSEKKRFSDQTIDQICNAIGELAEKKTGALICVEEDINLDEYINSGIDMDSRISSPLLISIFEDKTPLHDGAVIIREDRILAATCYLPMSPNQNIDKKYGTRHRAALGLSENTDAFSIVVSEETGKISLANEGKLIEDITIATLKNFLIENQNIKKESDWLKKLRERKNDSNEDGNQDGEDKKIPQ